MFHFHVFDAVDTDGYHLFFREDPKEHGYNGAREMVKCTQDDLWPTIPEGGEYPSPCMGRSKKDPGVYHIFAFESVLERAEEFERVDKWELPFRRWSDYLATKTNRK